MLRIPLSLVLLGASVACATTAACSDPALATRSGGNVWIDADPAIGLRLHDVDDGWAFVHAFEAFPGSVKGISLGHGNTESLEYQERITRELVKNFAPNSPPIFVGAASADDRGETDASIALAAALAKEPLTLLTMGRLTNIATTLRLHPELRSQVAELVILGGRREASMPSFGDPPLVLPDSNVEGDAQAVEELMASGIPITLIPNELTTQIVITEADLATLAEAGNAGPYLGDISRDWWALNDAIFGLGGFFPYDLFVTMYADDLLRPSITCSDEALEVVYGPDESFKNREEMVLRLQVPTDGQGTRRGRYCHTLADGAKALALRRLVGE